MSENKYFTLDNTDGYTQEELDFHNDNFELILIQNGLEINDYDADSWTANQFKGLSDKYFSEHMC